MGSLATGAIPEGASPKGLAIAKLDEFGTLPDYLNGPNTAGGFLNIQDQDGSIIPKYNYGGETFTGPKISSQAYFSGEMDAIDQSLSPYGFTTSQGGALMPIQQNAGSAPITPGPAPLPLSGNINPANARPPSLKGGGRGLAAILSGNR
jgi:hypothetical protein